jgi:hypothetical protein
MEKEKGRGKSNSSSREDILQREIRELREALQAREEEEDELMRRL